MGYKLLGFAVWQGSKLYRSRRRHGRAPRKLLAAGIVGLVIAGAVVVQRQASSDRRSSPRRLKKRFSHPVARSGLTYVPTR
ncbi:MAG: hypothetical protein ACXVQR_07535 [Solirubrobacteraceae bacterium]